MKKILVVLTLLAITNINAKIIEVNQLFNKTLVKVKKINSGTIKSYYGNTKINEENTIDIVTRYDGYITKLNANKTYMSVKKGDLLFSVYSDSVLSIQEELKVTKKINKQFYNSALNKLIALGIDQIELERIKNSSKSLKSVNVHSPINAIVMKKNVNNKSAIKKGTTILELANIESLWFIAQVYQKDISSIKLGMNAKIYIDGIDKVVKSKVDYIYPIVNSESKTIDVRFNVENKDMKIYPNMFATVKIETTKRPMLTLPKTAVLNKASKFYVFKPLSDREFEPIKIEAKRISSNSYEILDGLQENDEVINNALFLLDSDAVTNALYDTDSDDDEW